MRALEGVFLSPYPGPDRVGQLLVVIETGHTQGLSGSQKWRLGTSSLVLMTPSMAINASYFIATHETGLAAPLSWTLAGVAVGSVVLAGMTPLVLRKAWTNRRWGVIALATLGVAPLLAFNTMNAVGAASTLKDTTAGTRGAAIQVSSSIDAEIARLEARRVAPADLAAGRFPAMVEGELQAQRADLRWNRSRQCTDVTLPESKVFCATYARLSAALGAAQAVEKIDTEMGQLVRQKRQGVTGAVATGTTDPASSAIVRLLKPMWELGEQSVATTWSLLAAIAVEVMAFIGPLMMATLLEPAGSRSPNSTGGRYNTDGRERPASPARRSCCRAGPTQDTRSIQRGFGTNYASNQVKRNSCNSVGLAVSGYCHAAINLGAQCVASIASGPAGIGTPSPRAGGGSPSWRSADGSDSAREGRSTDRGATLPSQGAIGYRPARERSGHRAMVRANTSLGAEHHHGV